MCIGTTNLDFTLPFTPDVKNPLHLELIGFS